MQIGQGVYLQSSSDPACSSSGAALAICSSFTASLTPPPPPPPPPQPPSTLLSNDQLRRLGKHIPHPTHVLKCPRCASLDTKFCYYNNYSLSQPRYFCKNCKRYWTAGGALRNVPVGGGLRKNKRSKLKLAATAEADAAAARDQLLAAQLLQHQERLCVEGKPPSPVASSAGTATITSIATTTTMSLAVSGLPATYTATASAAAMASFHHHNGGAGFLRVSSGSDNGGGATAAAIYHPGGGGATEHQQQNSHHVQHCYMQDAHAHPPHFYSSFSTILNPSERSHCHHQTYNGIPANPVSGKYHGQISYADQLIQTSANNMQPSTSSAHPSYQVVSSSSCNAGEFSSTIKELVVKEEEQEILAANPNYDWQIISDHLFNGTGSEGFLPLSHGGSWPDLSQFHDSSGCG